MDLHMGSLHKYSLTCTKGTSLLVYSFLFCSGPWDSWRLILLVKAEAKKAFKTSFFFVSCVTMSPTLWPMGPHFPCFVSNVLIVALLVVFGIPGHLKFDLGFGFPHFTLECSESASVFLPALPVLASTLCRLFCFSFFPSFGLCVEVIHNLFSWNIFSPGPCPMGLFWANLWRGQGQLFWRQRSFLLTLLCVFRILNSPTVTADKVT